MVTGHPLLSLIKETGGEPANFLKNLDVEVCRIRLELVKVVQSGPDT